MLEKRNENGLVEGIIYCSEEEDKITTKADKKMKKMKTECILDPHENP